ncbi:MAG: translation initiation factor IF-2 [Methanobrevibacter sp.]|jgi:translation initiation factor 5B|nr:translation initiation factor IF-2 [Candidatus Methanovirga basalitermitum]
MKIRSPIISVLGHVDHGKTSLLDFIRGSTIASKEAGGITQHIGATEIPIDTINKICGKFVKKLEIVDTLPGLFFIDTPGHAAFTSLRKRGGALADLAILILDINEGFKPQTFEALRILRLYKTPFIIVANKVDRLFGWNPYLNASFSESFSKQAASVQQELDSHIYEIVGTLHKEGFQSERFDRVSDFASQISIVPISAKSGEGIVEVLTLLLGLAQEYLKKNLLISEDAPAKGSVLEIKEEQGLGLTIDVIIYDGVLKKEDEIVLVEKDSVLTTKIRSILKINPLEEMRGSKNRFKKVDEVVAAAGVKIVAPNLENVISGSPLRVHQVGSNVEEEILKEIEDITISTDGDGVLVKADTLGSLEAIINLLKELNILIRSADIGNVSRKDVVNASIVLKENPKHGVIFAFNVKIHKNAIKNLKETGVKVFSSDVIYQITEDYEEWLRELEESQKKTWLDAIVKPAKIRVIPKLVFRQSKPFISGIEVLSGTVKQNFSLMNQDGQLIGQIESMQDKGENLPFTHRGQKVAMSIKGGILGKGFEEGDELHVDIPEKHYKILIKEFKDKLTEDEFETLNEIVDIKRKNEPKWGEFEIFE